ncbi:MULTISPECIES: hypothetical protein [Bacillus]|uniref:Uncharacterized protein n=1 Tax=Bacillus vallismortis TaxID=72361 RepID=A0ABY4Y449_BACVA|nr:MULTISPECIES: hypothetical protein [Bacillus]MBL3647048.1 hypothetical protein [Bacillus sp. RHFS10]USP97254.1 hypothetical protein MKF32_09470 [Bacillus vallismortis]
MRKALRRLFKIQKNQSPDADGYLHILEKDINLELKQKIYVLEGLGEVVAEKLQRKYTDVFESQGKRNLSIKIYRDIDGDGISDLTAERCLEKEYRSQITINYGILTANEDEDIDAFTIDLWYYYGGFIGSGCGTLFDLNNDLEKEIEKVLIFLLNDKQSEK